MKLVTFDDGRVGELRQQARGNKLLQPLQSAMFRAHKERNQQRDKQQSPKPFWYAKGHGNFFQIVCDKSICATKSPHPPIRHSGKRSRYC